MKLRLLFCALPFVALATPSHALVGRASTADVAKGGDTRYVATDSKYSGVVGISFNSYGGESYTCTGSLLSDRRTIVTAAHCLGGAPEDFESTSIYFDAGLSADQNIFAAGALGVETRTVSDYYVHESYIQMVEDQNDVAVMTMSELAPDWATGYELYEGDATGREFTTAGYGYRSLGGTTGFATEQPLGTRRQGTNRYDFLLGTEDFAETYYPGYDALAASYGYEWGDMYVVDFDDGTSATDSSCIYMTGAGAADLASYCDTGTATEVIASPGDSGSAQFVDGKISSITSAGLAVHDNKGGDITGTSAGAVPDGTFGDLDIYVPVSIHAEWIKSKMIATVVPEPATWMQMLLGFALLGGAMRAARKQSMGARAV